MKPMSVVQREKLQIQCILKDFKIDRAKCADLAKQIGKQLKLNDMYLTIQRTTLIKLDMLDVEGLVRLKNNLVRTYGDMLVERDKMLYTKHVMFNIPYKTAPKTNKEFERVKKESQEAIAAMELPEEKRYIDVPLYRPKKQNRISKFVASLKKNMKSHVQLAPVNRNKIKQYLLEFPQFSQASQELQRYKMRQEELENVLEKAFKLQITNFLKENATLDQNQANYLIKIPKKMYDNAKTNNKSSLTIKGQQIQVKERQKEQQQGKKTQEISQQPKSKFRQTLQNLQGNIKFTSREKILEYINQQIDEITLRLKTLQNRRKMAFNTNEIIWQNV